MLLRNIYPLTRWNKGRISSASGCIESQVVNFNVLKRLFIPLSDFLYIKKNTNWTAKPSTKLYKTFYYNLTLIRVACQPLLTEGLVEFKTPTSRGRGVGLDFSRQNAWLRELGEGQVLKVLTHFFINIKHGVNYNWSILYNDPSSLSTSIELSKSSVFAAKSPLPLLVVF